MASDLAGLVLVAAGMAFAGSLHCLGMCGGFAMIARSRSAVAGPGPWSWFGVYIAGKTVTYMLLGVAAGLFGQVVALSGPGGRILAVAAGIVMVGMGLQLGGWASFERWIAPRVPGRLSNALSKVMAADAGGPVFRSRFLMGVLNGAIPCGLLYAAVAVAATAGSWWAGAVVMAVFGVVTVPSLWIASLAAGVMGPGRKVLLARIGAVTVILFGIVTMLRGSDFLRMLLMH